MKEDIRKAMNNIARRTLTIAVALIIAAFACAPVKVNAMTMIRSTVTGLYILGEKVEDGNLSGDGWSYDPASNTLTLSNFNYTGTGVFNVLAETEEIEEDEEYDEDEDWDDEEYDEDEDWDDEEYDEDDEDREDEDDDWEDEDDEDDDEDWEDEDEETNGFVAYMRLTGVIFAKSPISLHLEGQSNIVITDGTDLGQAINCAEITSISGSGELNYSAGARTGYLSGSEHEEQTVETETAEDEGDWFWLSTEQEIEADADTDAEEDMDIEEDEEEDESEDAEEDIDEEFEPLPILKRTPQTIPDVEPASVPELIVTTPQEIEAAPQVVETAPQNVNIIKRIVTVTEKTAPDTSAQKNNKNTHAEDANRNVNEKIDTASEICEADRNIPVIKVGRTNNTEQAAEGIDAAQQSALESTSDDESGSFLSNLSLDSEKMRIILPAALVAIGVISITAGLISWRRSSESM